MKVYLLVFESSLFVPPIVEKVSLLSQCEIVGVGSVAPKSKGSKSKWLSSQISYWGWYGTFWIASITALRSVIAKIPIIPLVFRKGGNLKMTCDYVGVDFRYVDDVNEENFIEEIKGKNVDVIISFQQQIFKEELLNAPNRVCLNVHTGKLPGYRGVKPVFWMMKNDEDTFGVTIHTMEKEIDTGSVVVRRPWRRVAGSSVLQNQFWSYECSSFAIVDALEKIYSGQEFSLDRVDSTSAYFKMPSAEDRDQAVRSGLKMV